MTCSAGLLHYTMEERGGGKGRGWEGGSDRERSTLLGRERLKCCVEAQHRVDTMVAWSRIYYGLKDVSQFSALGCRVFVHLNSD